MTRLPMKAILPAAILSLAACDLSNPDTGTGTGTGTATGTSTGTSTGSGTGTGTATGTGTGTGTGTTTDEYTPTSIANALAQGSSTLHAVSIANATVVALRTTPSGSGTFYIQDGSGPGIAVYRGATDSVALPKVGDTVNVKGHFTKYNGIYEITTKAGTANGVAYNHPLSIEVLASNGAVPPAISAVPADYAATASDKHDDQIGHVVQFAGPLEITDEKALKMTSSVDGGTTTRPAGFAITGGVLVNDSYVYTDCIKPLDGGVAALKLDKGIRGVWDRYQDYFAGSSSAPAPTVPVVYPMNCSDLQPE